MVNAPVRAGFFVAVGLLSVRLSSAAPAETPEANPAAELKAPDGIYRMAVSPDGKQLALGGTQGQVAILEAAALQSRSRLVPKQAASPECLAFNPDGTVLVVGSFDGTYTLWSLPAGTPVRQLNGEGLAWAGAFTPDGKRVLTYPTENGIGVWDAGTGERRSIVRFQGPGAGQLPRAAAFSADTRTLAISGGLDDDHSVRVWDTATGRQRQQFKEYVKLVDSLTLTPDGGRMVTGGEDGMARAWELGTRRSLGAWKMGGFVTAVAISADGKQAAACNDREAEIRVWDLASGQAVARFPGPEDGARELKLSPDGKRLYSADSRVVRAWDLPRR